MRLDKAKDCSIPKKIVNLIQNAVYWCKLSLAQERGLLFYQTRSHAIVLYDTLPAVCIEKVVCMKTKDEPYQKVRLTPTGCTRNENANRSARSMRTGCKNIL